MESTFPVTPRSLPLPGLIFAVIVALFPVHASGAPPLEEVRVAVEGSHAEARETAFTQALEQVLVRMTGRRILPGAPELETFMESAPEYVQAYRYEEGPEGERTLWVRFDRADLEAFIREADWPFWDADRPALMVWMVVQEGARRSLVADDDGTGIRRELSSLARTRGLPLILPLMDPEDWRRVSAAHVVGGFTGTLREASERYGPDGMLMAHLRPGDGGWQGRFRLSLGGEALGDRRFEAPQREGVLSSGVHWAADILSGREAARGDRTSSPGHLEVTIEGVGDLSDYLGARDHLARLEPVREVIPGGFTSERVRFRLRLRGDASDLERAARRDPALEVMPPEDAVDPVSLPAFRWVP
ncbi:MAG: DUF2066 domain-containing protein [Ectothiorhodospira sp.]